MKLSMKALSDLASSPKGKQLLRQARELDTPENRKKAAAMLRRVQGKKR